MALITRGVLIALVSALALALPGAVGAQQEDLSSPDLRMEWQEFKKLYDAGRIVVVDVRSAISFEAGHIPGARSVPLEEIEKQARALKKLGKPIVLYCA